MKIGTELKTWAHDLSTAAGIPVAIDARDLPLPGILITAKDGTLNTLDTTNLQLTLEIWIITSDTGARQVLDDLGDMLTKLKPHMDDLTDLEMTTIGLAGHAADRLPAIRGQITRTLTKEEN